MIIRRETPADVAAARAVQSAAFDKGAGEPVEAPLLDALRATPDWLPPFSLVAEIDGVIVGHNVCTRGFIDGHPALGLGPIGVQPARQRDGIGHALMHAMIGAAEALEEPVICLLGSPAYYSRFGFVAASTIGIEAPDPLWGNYFQALPLSAFNERCVGRFQYSAPFNDIDD